LYSNVLHFKMFLLKNKKYIFINKNINPNLIKKKSIVFLKF